MPRAWPDVCLSFAGPERSPCARLPIWTYGHGSKRCNAPRHAAARTEQASRERRDGPAVGLVSSTALAPTSLARHACFSISVHLMVSLQKTPSPRRSSGERYSCAACNGEGFVDERRHRELTETPGPLFVSASQRSAAERGAALPRYNLAVTNKNRKRERDRKRRQAAERTIENEEGRRKRSKATVVDDSEDDEGGVEESVEGHAGPLRASEDDISALERAMPPSSPREAATTPSPANLPDGSAPSVNATRTSTPAAVSVEEIGAGVTRSERVEAEAMLKLGLGKASRPSQATTDKILDAVFAVAGPGAMEDMLGLCRKWRDGLIYETKGDVERKTTALQGEWGDRVPEGKDKEAIVAVHVSAYWALCDDADDFVRAIVRRGRLADFWEAFQDLLRPIVKPNLGWKKKFGEVKKARLKEAHPDVDPSGKEYRRQERRFEHQLQYGERWARLRGEFGPGIFALLPSTVVTNSWVEQTLSATQFDAWLSILRRHNRPDATMVERAWRLVEGALSGEEPPVRLRLEDIPFEDMGRGCRDPSILSPSTPMRDEEEEDAFTQDGAFLEETDVT